MMHSYFDAEYDCPNYTLIEGDRMYHLLGSGTRCKACERYMKRFG